MTDVDGNLPIHIACRHPDASIAAVTYLIRAASHCVKVENGNMDLPIHTLLRNPSPNFQVVKALADNYKASLVR